jgi:hypothetical protein
MEFGMQFFPDVKPDEKSARQYSDEALCLVDWCDEYGYSHDSSTIGRKGDSMTRTTWQDGLQRLLRRVDATGEHVTNDFPHYGDPVTGRWTTSPGGD